jgi:hypothetical protein
LNLLKKIGEKPWSEWSTSNFKLKRETGFNKEDIEFIFALCKDDLSNFHGRKKARHSAVNRPRNYLSSHNLLLLALHSLWKNPPEEDLADTFDTPQRTINDAKAKLFPLLQRCLAHLIRIPTPIPRFDSGPLKGVCFIIDTTPTPIPKPSLKEDQKLYFNFKRRPSKYAMKTQVTSGIDLRIWNVGDTKPHSVHDLTLLRQSSVGKLLSKKRKGLGDSAYQGGANMIVPFKRRKGHLTESQKLFNNQVSHVRVTVENIFKRVKDFQIIKGIYRGDYHKLSEFNCIFKLVCSLVNLQLEKHPLWREQRSIKTLPDTI